MANKKTEAAGFVTAGPGLLVTTAASKWQKAVTETLQKLELTYVQYALLYGVAVLQGDNPVSQVEVAAYCATDVMLTSKHLRVLEKKGLILRRRHPTDTRARALEMTPNGVVVLGRATRAVERIDKKVFGEGASVDRLRKILVQVVDWKE